MPALLGYYIGAPFRRLTLLRLVRHLLAWTIIINSMLIFHFTRQDALQVHRQKPRNPTLTFHLRLRLPEPKIESLPWFPHLVTAIMKREPGCYIPTARHGTIFPAAFAALKYPVANKTLFLLPPELKADNEVSQRPVCGVQHSSLSDT